MPEKYDSMEVLTIRTGSELYCEFYLLCAFWLDSDNVSKGEVVSGTMIKF